MTSIQHKLIAKVAIHQIFKDENSDSQQIVDNSKKRMLKLLKIILKNNPSFGVFTTIDRSPETKRKANTELVHGCHGTFGDGGYKPLTSEEMLSHILDKVYSSAHSDSRKNQFRQPLKEDLKGNLKIALLKLPLYEINYNTGRISELNNQIFKNDKLGFIMDKNGSKATYLPDVFPDKSWQQIRDHLVQQKAGTSLDNKIKFYAYKTYDIKSTIDEALKLNLSNLNTILKKPITTNKTNKTNNTTRTSSKTNKLKQYSKSQIKTKKKINKKFTDILMNSSCGIIIPHAGEIYSGDARKNVFNLLNPKKYKKIIYLAALHGMDSTNNVYVLNYNDVDRKLLDSLSLIYKSFKFVYNLNSSQESEHSYKWVKDELDRYGFTKERFVLAPSSGVNILKFTEFINNFLDKFPNTCLMSTTDLIHYGDRYNYKNFEYPTQYYKIINEERLIRNMVNSNYFGAKQLYSKNKNLSCGKQAILIYLSVAKSRNWIGKVADYYDSFSIEKFRNNDLMRYKIHDADTFVSYVSIVHYKNNNLKLLNTILDIDNKLCKSYLLSYIEKKFINSISSNNNYKFKIPIWCWYNNLFTSKNSELFLKIKLNIDNNILYLKSNPNINKNLGDNLTLIKLLIKHVNNCFMNSKVKNLKLKSLNNVLNIEISNLFLKN